MDEITHVNEALQESLADIEPDSFRERLGDVLDAVSLTPGVLTVRTARAIDPGVEAEVAAMRGAGVQLSYEGLRLTRSLIRAEPWAEDGADTSHDIDLLAAEVLVARGFYHLSDTGVATDAVEIVRRFGRNQTHERRADGPEIDRSLEVDVIDLAVRAGADLATGTVPPVLDSYGADLARELEAEPLPEPEDALPGVEERIATLVTAPGSDDPGSQSSTIDP